MALYESMLHGNRAGGCTFNKFVITCLTKWRMGDMNVNIGRCERRCTEIEALSWLENAFVL